MYKCRRTTQQGYGCPPRTNSKPRHSEFLCRRASAKLCPVLACLSSMSHSIRSPVGGKIWYSYIQVTTVPSHLNLASFSLPLLHSECPSFAGVFPSAAQNSIAPHDLYWGTRFSKHEKEKIIETRLGLKFENSNTRQGTAYFCPAPGTQMAISTPRRTRLLYYPMSRSCSCGCRSCVAGSVPQHVSVRRRKPP